MSKAGNFLGLISERFALTIVFVVGVLCLAGIFCALHTPSSVFPRTDFPRIAIIVDNGITPVDEMLAGVTRPIEEAMKGLPGAVSVRSSTGRGASSVNVFFDWNVDMAQAELFVLARLGEIKADLPSTATTEVHRVSFSAFPILGLSLTSASRDTVSLWETAQYDVKPRLLQIPGISSVDIVGGHAPEYQVTVDPLRLAGARLGLQDIVDALERSNSVSAAGLIEENYHLYLTAVDGRLHSAADIGALPVAVKRGHPILIKDLAAVARAAEPGYTLITAQGHQAVLLNLVSQPTGSTLDIAAAVRVKLREVRDRIPPDIKVGYFYDQSAFVHESVLNVWEAIGFGLILSVVILYIFLRHWGTVAIAIAVIPATVLVTFIALRLLGQSFNMMTLGGIAAAIGLVIDDAIVVAESIFSQLSRGLPRTAAIREGLAEIIHPLIGSTLTPVVVFLPLTYLTGITGVFFRALAVTMVVSLLTSLVLALTVTPSLAEWFLRGKGAGTVRAPSVSRATSIYESALRTALRHRGLVLMACGFVALFGVLVYRQLKTDFLPAFDEGGFIVDFKAPPGTSLTETSRMLDEAETLIRANPDVESYSRRLGAELGLFFTESNRGDYAVKLKANRGHATDEVMSSLREKFAEQLPAIQWDFHGVLGDLVGDLALTPDPIEVKIFSPDSKWLESAARRVEGELKSIPGVVDTSNGITETGPTYVLHVRPAAAARFGLTTQDIANVLNTAIAGRTASQVIEGDRIVKIRVRAARDSVSSLSKLRSLRLRNATGDSIFLSEVADFEESPSAVELDREDLRQEVTVTGRLEGRDLGGAMAEIQAKLAADPALAPGSIAYGGLYEQQKEAFSNLLVVLLAAVLLVFTVLLFEFRTLSGPLAIILGAVLALSGTVGALWITGISLSIVAFLGAIIGVGLVAKNGILMLERVEKLQAQGLDLEAAIVRSGDRRLRPVLMTTLAAATGMLPLALGTGTGAQMLQPLAVAVIGALFISMLLSLIATPTVYYLLARQKAE